MAKLSSFIYCINSERTPTLDGKGETINAIGILSVITPEFVPGTFSFSIIFSIVDIDLKQDNRIKIIFTDDNDKEILNSNEIILPTENLVDTLNIPDEYKGINMCMDLRNIVFEKDGVYKTTIIFNGNEIGTNEIYVKGRR